MDYFEQQQQLCLSSIMYREKDTANLFSQNDRKAYILDKNGICSQWEKDFRRLLTLLQELGLDISSINKDEFFTMNTITLISEINNWIEWVLNTDYIIPDYEKTKIYTFNVKAGMDKTFYVIAKLCDNANSIDRITDGYRVTFKGENLREIEMMYFLRSGWDWDIYNKNEGIIASYLVKYSKLYRMIISSKDMLNQVESNYGYYVVPKSIKENIFYKIQKKSKEFQKKADNFYTNMLLEKRVKSKWTNEYRLFELINNHNCHAQYQYHCDWLGQQSLDIYIETAKIGIEYQGEQHYKPVDIWGGEEALKENQKRDLRKKKLCAENNVRLLEWLYQIPVNDENVVKFMKENDIPFVENKVDIVFGNEMAPIIKEEKRARKKIKENNIKNYIVQYDLNGNYVEKYLNMNSASEKVGVSQTSISKVIKGLRNSAGGYIWRKVDVEEIIPQKISVVFDVKKTNSGMAKRISLLDEKGLVKQEFTSIAEAARNTGISVHHIQNELAKDNSREWMYLG